MKSTTVTAKQSFLGILNSFQNSDQMNAKDLSKIEIVEKMKLQNTVGKKIITLTRIKRMLLIEKAG